MARTAELASYCRKGKDAIPGWFGRVDSELFARLFDWQRQHAIAGGVAEIGVHRGKSFVALCLALEGDVRTPSEKAYGIDLFDRQQLNKDKSGVGTGMKADVIDHLTWYRIPLNQYVLDERSSEDVSPADILQAVGRVRFFSIDGGHWRRLVAHDLTLAEAVLTEGGVIALDDWMRAEWPEVTIGFTDWFASRPSTLVPFATGFNKLYLCHEPFVPAYQAHLAASAWLRPFLQKTYPLYGRAVPIYQKYMLPEMPLKEVLSEVLKLKYPDRFIRWMA